MKRAPLWIGVVAAAAAGLMAAAPAAQAIPGSDRAADSLTLVGSDTTQDVMNGITTKWNADTTNNPTPRDTAYNILAFGTGAKTVPGDSACGSVTWSTTPTGTQRQSPNGSGAGKSALAASAAAGDGCVDIARSSSARSASDPSTARYFAYARDALSWASFSTSASPSNLTLQQIQDIYSCKTTNWSTVGGKSAGIQRYLPQAGSGSRNFFVANVLGGVDPTTVSSSSCPAVKTFQENDGASIPSTLRYQAIFPYSAAQYVAQSSAVTTDRRDGTLIRAIGGQNPVKKSSTGTDIPNTAVYRSTSFPGARDVFNVLDTRSPQYREALRMVGFDSAGPSALCRGAYAATISKYGFVPLTDAGGVSRYCRAS